MFKSNVLLAMFVFSLAFSINANAKLYKWVDDKGTTHYGEIIPPEYANKEKDTINKAGLVDKRPEKPDAEAIRAKQEAENKRKVDNQLQIEQERRNSALLNTYSNEKEIDLALERSLVLINARIDSNRLLQKSSQNTLTDLTKEAETRTKEGKKIPASLTSDIEQMQARVNRYTTELTKSEEELAAVKTRFANEKILFRKLKGTAPTSYPPQQK